MTNELDGIADDIICRNRIYKCLGCDFVGNEDKALDHQIQCDHPMELQT